MAERWWLVTEASPNHGTVGAGVFVQAGTEEEAASLGMHALWVEAWEHVTDGRGDPEPITSVAVFDGVGRQWRAVVGAEPVPDEFQCCGGMPAHPLGTTDEHTAVCPTVTRQEVADDDCR